jgi:hypothetical protein
MGCLSPFMPLTVKFHSKRQRFFATNSRLRADLPAVQDFGSRRCAKAAMATVRRERFSAQARRHEAHKEIN